MATATQVKLLLQSHGSGDEERFFAIALQVAATEARLGHNVLANEIREIIDKSRRAKRGNAPIKFPQELAGMMLLEQPNVPLSALVISEQLRERIERIIQEHREQTRLKSHGLSNRRKILLSGPPGTGKTTTARVLSHELRLPLYTIQVDKLMTRFLGETSAKLRQIFDRIRDEPGVYLFDEFDAIGGDRSLDNDIGEIRRVLNALLQFIEQDVSDSIIIGATNNPRLLDRALFRRFDDVLAFTLPDSEARMKLIENVLGGFKAEQIDWSTILKNSEALSHAEIDYACRDAVKLSILAHQKMVDTVTLNKMLHERNLIHQR